MRIQIPFTSLALSINFEQVASFDEKLTILDDLSYKALVQKLNDEIKSVVVETHIWSSVAWNLIDRDNKLPGVIDFIENNNFKQQDLNNVLDYVVTGVAHSRNRNLGNDGDAIDLIKVLRQAGAEITTKMIDRIFHAEDVNGTPDHMKYFLEAGDIDQRRAHHYSKLATNGEMKQIMAFGYGLAIHQERQVELTHLASQLA